MMVKYISIEKIKCGLISCFVLFVLFLFVLFCFFIFVVVFLNQFSRLRLRVASTGQCEHDVQRVEFWQVVRSTVAEKEKGGTD